MFRSIFFIVLYNHFLLMKCTLFTADFLNYCGCVIPYNHILVPIKLYTFYCKFKISQSLSDFNYPTITFWCGWKVHFLLQINYFFNHSWCKLPYNHIWCWWSIHCILQINYFLLLKVYYPITFLCWWNRHFTTN